MIPRMLLVAAIAIALIPMAAMAQNAGFIVGLGPGAVGHSVSPGFVGPVVQPFVSAPPFGGVFVGPTNGFVPHHPRGVQGQVFFVGPQHLKVAPGHQPLTPVHPLRPHFRVVGPGFNGVFPHPHSFVGTQIVGPATPIIVNHPRQVHPGNPNALIGLSRRDVLRRFGRPNVTIVNSGGETLIFGGTTVIIQNGAVAVVR